MTASVPQLLLFLVGAAAITAAAMAWRWWMEPVRRSRRALAARLGGVLDGLVLSADRGEGVGFRVSPPGIAVLRGPGDQGLIFGFEELLGVELMINGEVRARAYRGEPRRPLDVTRLRLEHLALRLVFDDLRYPEFELRLREPGDAGDASSEALDAARRMFAHLEAVLRQTGTAEIARPPAPAPPPPALAEDEPEADDPPF